MEYRSRSNSIDDGEENIQSLLDELRDKVNTIDFSNVEISSDAQLGSGTFGVVRKGTYRRPNGEVVDCAVKLINSSMEILAFKNEVTQLSRVNHENIVTIYGACLGRPCYLVMEYAAGGSLYNVLHNKMYTTHVQYSAAHAISWCYQCIKGVDYLHSMRPKPLVHRDLKPPNLLLVDGMLTLKICDFGTACDLHTNMTNCKGSAAWMAPEVFQGSNYSEKCDIFSWSIILWEVLSRQKPFEQYTNAFQIMWAINNNFRPPLLKNIPRVLSELMQRCWNQDFQQRPKSKEVLDIMTSLFNLCDPEDLTPLQCPIPLKSGSSSSTVSGTGLEGSYIDRTPTATQRRPNLTLGSFPPISTYPSNLISPDTPSTSRQGTPDQISTNPPVAHPTHRRQLSGGLIGSALVLPKESAAPRKLSWPPSAYECEAYEDLGIQSHLLVEPRLQPLPPLQDSEESVSINECHKLKCQWFYRQKHEIQLLKSKSTELDQQLRAGPPPKKITIEEKMEELLNEHHSLLKMESELQKQLRKLKKSSPDDGWVVIENSHNH